MTAPHADQLIAGYLARLADAAAALPKGPRTELTDDMRSHIAEARARESGEETDATILNILDRLGEPAVVVAETRDRLGLQAVQPYRPGVLEIGALILVPFMWPIGVLLLWLSPAWNRRDKLMGSLLPPGGYIGIGVVGALTAHGQGCSILTDATGKVLSNTCPAPSPWQGVAAAFLTFVIYVLPLVTAGYLAIRLRWGRRATVRFA